MMKGDWMMNAESLDRSENRLPWCTDWHRYDTPTVLRRHGREFLERFWREGDGSSLKRLYRHPSMSQHIVTLSGVEPLEHGEPLRVRVDVHVTLGDRHEDR